MTNNQQPTAEQLVREHLEHINSGLWNDVYGTCEDFKTIFESYLSLLDQLKIAKDALEDIAKYRESDGNVRRNIRQDIALQAISQITL